MFNPAPTNIHSAIGGRFAAAAVLMADRCFAGCAEQSGHLAARLLERQPGRQRVTRSDIGVCPALQGYTGLGQLFLLRPQLRGFTALVAFVAVAIVLWC
jgi:hypothetical protein